MASPLMTSGSDIWYSAEPSTDTIPLSKACEDVSEITTKVASNLTTDIHPVCACKGIRRCAICRPVKDRVPDELSCRDIEKYLYCFNCHKAFREGAHTSIDGCESDSGSGIEIARIRVWNDFVSSNEETFLLKEMYSTEFVDSQSGRRKQDYGPKVNFKKKKLNTAVFSGLPAYSKFIVDRMSQTPELSDFFCVELCNLEYVPERESCIDPHMDDCWLWGERLVTLNLCSDTFLCLTPSKTEGNNPVPLVRVPVPQRSLLMLAGNARYEWNHCILSEDICSKRIAMTFRELSLEFSTGENAVLGRDLVDKAYTFCGISVR